MFSKCIIIIAVVLCVSTVHGKWSCKETAECAGLEDALCHLGECMCARGGWQIDEGRKTCIEAAPYLNSPCLKTFQCQHLVTGYTCHNETGTCVCETGYRYLHGRCWPGAGFGEPCEASQQCADPLMPLALACLDGVCACRQDHYSRERGLCRKIASKLDDSCILDQDCQIPSVPGAVCDMRLLLCKDPSRDEDTESHAVSIVDSATLYLAPQGPRILEGEECSSDEDCEALGPALCSNRQCACEVGYYPSSNRGLCVAELGMPVTDSKHCPGFARVVDGVCDCPAGFFYQDNWNCRKPSRRFGDSCNDDVSCFTFGSSGRCGEQPVGEQPLRTCRCDPATSAKDEANQICQLFDRTIGDACTTSDQCPNNVECLEQECGCKEDQAPDALGTFCIIGGLDLDQDCIVDFQCKASNSRCADGKCACQDTYFQDDKVCLLGLGGSCVLHEDCMVGNSSCADSKCKCLDGHISSPTDIQRCFKLVDGLSGSCDIDGQCWPTTGDNSTVSCEAGLCTCREDSHSRGGKCWKKTGLKEVCARSPQCYTLEHASRTECRNSQCQCIIGFTEEYEPDRCSGSSPLRSTMTYFRTLAILLLSVMFISIA